MEKRLFNGSFQGYFIVLANVVADDGTIVFTRKVHNAVFCREICTRTGCWHEEMRVRTLDRPVRTRIVPILTLTAESSISVFIFVCLS